MRAASGRVRSSRQPCEWALETCRNWGRPVCYQLYLRVTGADAQAVAAALTPERGRPAFEYSVADGGRMHIAGILVTVEEAALIAGGTSPLDVLLSPEWDCGYRLNVVPEDLSGVLT